MHDCPNSRGAFAHHLVEGVHHMPDMVHEGLLYSEKEGIYFIREGADFHYTDGSEAYLLSVLGSVEDRTSLSWKLCQYIRDWSSAYHLSPERANLFRCFAFSNGKHARVLELGQDAEQSQGILENSLVLFGLWKGLL